MWIYFSFWSFLATAQVSDPWLLVKPTLLLEFDHLTTRLRKLQTERDFPSFDAIDTRLAEIHFKERAKALQNKAEDLFYVQSVRQLLEKSLESGQIWTWPEAWAYVGYLPHNQREKFTKLEGYVLRQEYGLALKEVLEQIRIHEETVASCFVLSDAALQACIPVLKPMLDVTLQENPGFSDGWRHRQMKRYQAALRKEGRSSYLDHFGPDFGFWELFARIPAYHKKNPVPLLGLNRITEEGREFPRAILGRYIWVAMWEHVVERFSLPQWLEHYRRAFQVLDPLLSAEVLSNLGVEAPASPLKEATNTGAAVLDPQRLMDLYEVTHLLFFGFQIPKPFPVAWEDCYPSRRTALARSKFFMQGRVTLKPLSGTIQHPEGVELCRIVAVLRSWFQLWVQKSLVPWPAALKLSASIFEELFVRSYLKLTKEWQQIPFEDGFAFSFKFIELPTRYFISDTGLLVSEDVGNAGWFVEKQM